MILPDGTLLAVGGNSSGQEGSPQRETVLYDPATNSWTRLADQSEQRAYHSTALLLPDGRVFSGGDNTASGGGNDDDVVEVFEPPYLFRGPRPSIVSAPSALGYGSPFAIEATGSPTRAVLMSPGATTHGNDMNQRHVELSVTPTAGGLSAVAPANANLAPPGNYMLFTLTADGVPSVARWVRLGGGAPPPPPPNSPPTAAFTFLPASPQTGQQVTFTDASTDSDGTIESRAWDLDNDGTFEANGAQAQRSFPSAGTYTVRLQVTDDADTPATATTTRQVTVSDGPPPPPPPPPPGNLVANPSFEVNTVGWSGYQGSLTREAQVGAPHGGAVARVAWTSGTYFTIDGGNNVTSTAAATYTATAWVKAATASSIGKPIQIKLRERTPAGATVADVGSVSVSLTTSWQQLTVQRTTAAGNRLGVRLSHTSAVSGNAIYADAFTLSTGGPEPPPPNSPPTAAFTFLPASPQTGQQVTFTDASTDSDGTIESRAWDLDNNGTFEANGAQAQRSFPSPAPTRCACRSPTTPTARDRDHDPPGDGLGPRRPNSPPTAAFTFLPASPQTGQPVTFTDASTDSDGTIASRAWDLDNDGTFDDGNGARPSAASRRPAPTRCACRSPTTTARPRPRPAR